MFFPDTYPLEPPKVCLCVVRLDDSAVVGFHLSCVSSCIGGIVYEPRARLVIDLTTHHHPSHKQVRFVTPIKHANVNPHGRICLSILDRNYTVETTLHDVLASIFGLLLQPETSDPVDTTLAQLFYKADGSYEATILAHVRTHASSKSLAQWKAALAGGGGGGGGAGGGGHQVVKQDPDDEPGFVMGAPAERRASARLKGKRPNHDSR
jgi:ubiquitin-protein ligase